LWGKLLLGDEEKSEVPLWSAIKTSRSGKEKRAGYAAYRTHKNKTSRLITQLYTVVKSRLQDLVALIPIEFPPLPETLSKKGG
jgi:hypothetical protein